MLALPRQPVGDPLHHSTHSLSACHPCLPAPPVPVDSRCFACFVLSLGRLHQTRMHDAIAPEKPPSQWSPAVRGALSWSSGLSGPRWSCQETGHRGMLTGAIEITVHFARMGDSEMARFMSRPCCVLVLGEMVSRRRIAARVGAGLRLISVALFNGRGAPTVGSGSIVTR